MKRHYDGLEPEEEVIAGLYRHPITLFKMVLVIFSTWAIFFGLFFLALFLRTVWALLGPITVTLALTALLLGHTIVFILLIEYFVSKIIITNKRLIYVRYVPFFEDDINYYTLGGMQKFEQKKQGIIKNIFDYGDIISDLGGPVTFKDIAYPNQVINLFEALKAKKNLHEVSLKKAGIIPARTYRFLTKRRKA